MLRVWLWTMEGCGFSCLPGSLAEVHGRLNQIWHLVGTQQTWAELNLWIYEGSCWSEGVWYRHRGRDFHKGKADLGLGLEPRIFSPPWQGWSLGVGSNSQTWPSEGQWQSDWKSSCLCQDSGSTGGDLRGHSNWIQAIHHCLGLRKGLQVLEAKVREETKKYRQTPSPREPREVVL